MAVGYELVLEDRIISRAAHKKHKRPFSTDVDEIIRHAVGNSSIASKGSPTDSY